MKRLAIAFVSIVLAAVLVGFGWWIGFEQRLLTEAYAVPVVDKQINEAACLTRLIETLDSGEIEDAKHLLILQLDGHILSISQLLDYTDARTRQTALKIFSGINEYRAKRPSTYAKRSTSSADVAVEAAIASILQRAKEGQR